MKIHELARLSGVNPETIRNVPAKRPVLHPAKLANGYFDYSACNLYELMFVRKLRGANLGLETIASFYAEDGQAGALRNMKQEIRALEEAIRELEQRKKQLMSTLGHYVLFSNQPQQVQELTCVRSAGSCRWSWNRRTACADGGWNTRMLCSPASASTRRIWNSRRSRCLIRWSWEAYTEDLKRLKLPLPPQARRMPGGTYLSSFLEAETDGTPGRSLQPVIDYAAAHHYRFCPEQGAFLYCLNGGEEALQLVFCFQVRVEPETDKTKRRPQGMLSAGALSVPFRKWEKCLQGEVTLSVVEADV